MTAEHNIEQIRNFVAKGYTSVAARIAKSALQHYDELTALISDNYTANEEVDKMVEEMRQKLFSMRATKDAMDKLSKDDKLMMYGYHDCINEMLMWTKSKQP